MDGIKMKDGIVVDIQITGKCNMHCKFCCGAVKFYDGPNLETFKKIVNKLLKVGCTIIVFSGGEPLVKEDITKMIKYAHDAGLGVYLSTNGLLLPKNYDKIKDYISCIGLPIDGSTPEINERMTRNKELFESTISILKHFKRVNARHKVKVGTVVSKVNKEDIKEIAKLLFNDNSIRIDTYRLYQFSPLRNGKLNRKDYEISKEEFERICNDVINLYPKQNIVPLSDDDSNDSYIFINPNMNIEILKGGEFVDMGNILHMDDYVLRNIFTQNLEVINKCKNNRRWLSKDG